MSGVPNQAFELDENVSKMQKYEWKSNYNLT